jgi:hypothetical protein
VTYNTYDTEDEFGYDDLVEYVRSYFESKYPSLERISEWLDREDRAILENRLVYIGVSEYCGLVSVWVVPKEDYPDLTAKFIKTITPYFEKVGELRKVGTFSNGEAVFEKKEG